MKLRSSRVLRRVTPRVDPQYHIGVPDPHDLDRPHYTLLGLHTTPGDKFYNANPIVWSNPGSSRESSMEPMDTDEAQQITDRLTQGIQNSGGDTQVWIFGEYTLTIASCSLLSASADRSITNIGSTYPKFGCSHSWRIYGSSNTD